jgi:hypothetical protein
LSAPLEEKKKKDQSLGRYRLIKLIQGRRESFPSFITSSLLETLLFIESLYKPPLFNDGLAEPQLPDCGQNGL